MLFLFIILITLCHSTCTSDDLVKISSKRTSINRAVTLLRRTLANVSSNPKSTSSRYGDRSPRSFLARIFSVVWILAGLVLTSILMGSITNALTTVTFSVRSIKLYGMKVAAIEGSPSYRVGIRRNAKVNPGWFAEWVVLFVCLL